MEVIFIKDLKNQGKKGDVKNVKDGYAKNYLIKNGYAIPKTKESINKLEHEKKVNKQKEEEIIEKQKKVKEKLDNKTITFTVKTSKTDKVFGSISSKQIKEELKKEGYDIEKNQIKIDNPIQTLGFHNVKIELYHNIEANIKVHVIK